MSGVKRWALSVELFLITILRSRFAEHEGGKNQTKWQI